MIKHFLQKVITAVIESREKAAAREVAKMLVNNPDFKSWSEYELYEAVLNKENPVYLDKTPVNA
jgi:negative regulator of sigma E activity